MWTSLLAGTLLALTAMAASMDVGRAHDQQEARGKPLYGKLCATCHGEADKGDAPAAAAFDPKPTDLSAAAFQEGRTDGEIATVIGEGKNLMPGFGTQLSAAEIGALVAYLRTLAASNGS